MSNHEATAILAKFNALISRASANYPTFNGYALVRHDQQIINNYRVRVFLFDGEINRFEVDSVNGESVLVRTLGEAVAACA